MLLGHLLIIRLLDQIPENGQYDPGYFFLDRIAQDVCQDRYDVEFVHLLRQQGVESQHPQAEDELVLNLEVDASRQDGEERRYAIHGDECKTVLVDTEHHLQTTGNRLDVFVVLQKFLPVKIYTTLMSKTYTITVTTLQCDSSKLSKNYLMLPLHNLKFHLYILYFYMNEIIKEI